MISSHVLQSFFYMFHHFPQPLLPQLGPSMHSPGKRLLEQCHSRVLAEESHQLCRLWPCEISKDATTKPWVFEVTDLLNGSVMVSGWGDSYEVGLWVSEWSAAALLSAVMHILIEELRFFLRKLSFQVVLWPFMWLWNQEVWTHRIQIGCLSTSMIQYDPTSFWIRASMVSTQHIPTTQARLALQDTWGMGIVPCSLYHNRVCWFWGFLSIIVLVPGPVWIMPAGCY